MEKNDLDLLDQYFNGQLDPEAAAAVQARSRTDAAFGAEFDLRQRMDQWLRQEAGRNALRGTLGQLGAAHFQPEMKARPGWLLRNRSAIAAAASVVVIALATWFLWPAGSASYSDYNQHAPLFLVERGPDQDDPAAAAEAAFNRQDYPAALTALDQVLARQPEQLTALLYKGITLLELRRPADARTILTPIAAGNSALRGEARWYLALSYLMENNATACAAALKSIETGEQRYQAAQALLKRLE